MGIDSGVSQIVLGSNPTLSDSLVVSSEMCVRHKASVFLIYKMEVR